MYDSIMGVISFLSGLAIFIYGMHIMSSGLQNSANSRFKDILAAITKNKFFGVITGVVVTALIQSSSSTTVMLVGFVNAGLMTLGQTVGVIMGANIGTTVTSWIVSLSSSSLFFLKTSFLAPIALIIGVVMIFFGQKEKTKTMGQIVVGFGFLFFGLEFMSDTVEPLKDSPAFADAFATLGSNPVLGILAGAVVTAAVQSSSASVGILQVLALNGIVTWDAAVFIILGQNIGTCITAMLASIGASPNSKATAYIHLLFNLIGSIIFAIGAVIYFQINPAAGTLEITAVEISIFHSIFNITNTIMLFPFANQIVKIAAKLAGVDMDAKTIVTLDERLLDTPEIALISVYNEIERMSKIAHENVVNSLTSITTKDGSALAKEVIVQERAVNEIDKNITTYLIKMSHVLAIDDALVPKVNSLLHVINDIEQVSDYAAEIAKQSIAMSDEEIFFTDEGCKELNNICNLSVKSFDDAVKAVLTNDEKLGFSVIDQEREIDKLEAKYRDLHITRLTAGECNFGTKAYYTDILSLVERVSDRASNMIAYK